jgi:hypothetical protein
LITTIVCLLFLYSAIHSRIESTLPGGLIMSSSEETPKYSSEVVPEKDLVATGEQENDTTPEGPIRERTIHGWKWIATAASLYIGALIYGLDSTIVADIQPNLVQQFNNFESLTWAGTGFPLGSFCSILPG